jgi:hypothetical protein
MAFRKFGFGKVEDGKAVVLRTLEKMADRTLRLSDKSSPEEVRAALNMSKSSFKAAIGILYRERRICIAPDHIRLLSAAERARAKASDGDDEYEGRYEFDDGSDDNSDDAAAASAPAAGRTQTKSQIKKAKMRESHDPEEAKRKRALAKRPKNAGRRGGSSGGRR